VFLDEILATTREDVERRRACPLPDRVRPLRPRLFREAFERPGLSVVAEVKRASPSKGPIRPDLDPADIALAYARAGVAAISCLTEERRFLGSLEDLAAVSDTTTVPVLRKDFVVDEHQLDEAVAFGADAVLLIVAALSHARLQALSLAAHERGLATLIEAHDSEEALRALDVGPSALGINNRDLRTFDVDLRTTATGLEALPSNRPPVVAESGIREVGDLRQVAGWGADGVLVGESFMRAPDVESAAREFVEAGRLL